MPELRQLRYFVMVAEEGQITRAASRLHLAQPALSQAIAQLEARLGVALFVRHARGMTLTPAGEAYLEAARTALTAVADADRAAQSSSRADRDLLEWGFLGWPPMVQAPELFDAFATANPDAQMSFRELSWPVATTAAWLSDVDVALCFSPTPHPDVQLHPVRIEPRAVVLAKTHPLAERKELAVEDVLDETFCGDHPSLEPVRAAFWKLDDHRGGPARTTTDRASNALELIACVSTGRSITTAPASSAATFLDRMPALVAIPLRDAKPTVLCLVWHAGNRSPLVDALIATARSLGNGPRKLARERSSTPAA
jgi:DNA-binding transcriptional LysR family regulator